MLFLLNWTERHYDPTVQLWPRWAEGVNLPVLGGPGGGEPDDMGPATDGPHLILSHAPQISGQNSTTNLRRGGGILSH